MKSTLPCSCRSAVFAGALALVGLTAAHADAALTWNTAGPTNNWSTAVGNGNWSPGGIVWTNGEDAIFGATPEAVSVTTANTVDDITFGASWTIGNGAGSLTLADLNSNISVTNGGDTATISETIAGPGLGITKLGNGTLRFNSTGANTYSAPTIVDAGTLWINVVTGLATLPTGSATTVNSGATLRFDSITTANPSITVPSISLNGGTLSYTSSGTGKYASFGTGGLSVDANSVMNLAASGAGGNFFFSGPLTGSANLTVNNSTNGAGVRFSGVSTYSGVMTVNGNATGTAGTGSGVTFSAGSNMPNASFIINGTMELGNQNAGTNASLGWANGAVSGQTFEINALGGSGTVLANMGTAGSTRTLSVGNNNGGDDFTGVIANGANNTLSFIKNGGGTQILSGANTYSGTTTINNGALQIGAGGATGTLGSGSVSIASGASLIFDRSNAYTIANAITGSGGVTQNGAGTLTFSTAKAYTGATTVNAGAITHTAAVTNATTYAGAGTVNFDSGSSLGGATLFGASFAGQINLNTSISIANVANVFTNNRGDLNIASGTTFSINGVVGDATGPIRQFDELTGSGDIINGAIASVAPTTLTLGANNGNGGMADFSGDITSSSPVNGRISIIKSGSGSQTLSGNIATGTGTMTVNGGTLVLSGANTYAGLTTINGGTLLVNGSLNSSANGVTVNAGGTLGGTGSISRAVTVNGTLAPGASIQTLSSGTLTFNNGSTFDYEYDSAAPLASAGDLQLVNGALNLNGVVNLALSDLSPSINFELLLGTTLSLINYTGVWDGDLFTYGGGLLADGATFANGKYFWEIDYNATSGGVNFPGEHLSGQFVNISLMGFTVPEPSTFVLLGLASLGLGVAAYRRQSQRRRAASRAA